MHILGIDRNKKSPLQISGKVAGCLVRTLKTFHGTHLLGASRGLLCNSSAVLFLRVLGNRTRSSATTERQRVSYTHLSRLTHWSCTSLSTASVLQVYNRLAKLVSTLSANKPCDIRTLSWIGHSRSFKVILISAGRNPEWSVVVMCN